MGKVSTEKDFWDRVNIDGPTMPHMQTPCWIWVGGCTDKGYGRVRFQWKVWLAHRLAYKLHYGPFPEEFDICHHCDNPPCMNPEHLFRGTAKDNILDMMMKGRAGSAPGTRNASAKLTESDVIEIRRLHTQGISYTQLVLLYRVGKTTVSRIIRRKSWKHI